jgi:hypothetical protein
LISQSRGLGDVYKRQPIRFGTKKKVLKIFELLSFAVTKSARPNATRLIRIIDTNTNEPVNESVDQNPGS